MKRNKTIIVGGGLAGLYAAHLLQQQGIDYLLIEAQPRLGGRILGAQTKQNKDHYFDLGPTWIFPHQAKIQRLVKQLGLTFFEQYASGDVLYQTNTTQPPQRVKGAGELRLFRIQGGCQSLISALLNTLDKDRILPNHRIDMLERQDNLWHLSVNNDAVEQIFSADQLFLAMPPRIIAQYLGNKQWLSKLLLSDLQKSPTWMAGQAKFAASYAKPFWREQGLSGQIFSQVGPMVEVHDASTDNLQHYALFGFIGWPASRRSQITEQQLKDACLAQLISCYGSVAEGFSECYIKDWATDQFTCTANDRLEPSRHPDFPMTNHLQELNALQLHLIGSEFANIDPGYLEGAMDAVDSSLARLFS